MLSALMGDIFSFLSGVMEECFENVLPVPQVHVV